MPVSLTFESMDNKHIFLKHAKNLKGVGLRYSTTAKRQDLSADFDNLKSKGHKPYRGPSFWFCHADKTCTCKRDGANTDPDAQV